MRTPLALLAGLLAFPTAAPAAVRVDYLRDVKPVGYHAWASDKYLALLVLGQQGQPPTLQVADATIRLRDLTGSLGQDGLG